MRTRYTYCGTNVIEVVIADDFVDVNILPAVCSQEMPPAAAASQPTQDVVEPPPAALQEQETVPEPQGGPIEPLAVAQPLTSPEQGQAPETAAYTRTQRAKMGSVRTVKTLIFTVGGEASVYVVNNFTSLNLPPGIGLAVGAAAYGVNKYLKPENGGVL